MTIRTPNNSYYVSGASGGQNHTLPFGADRFEDDDLFVYVWNTSTEAWDKKTVTTHYTVSSTQVSFTSGNIPSTRVIVLRKTDVDEDFPKADFVAGASIKAQDLDNNQLQALRGLKELRDQKLSAVPSITEDGTPSNPKMYANLDMNGYKIVNQPAGHITSTDILDGTIATADVADSAITAAKLASDSVTTAKIANDAVNGTKIADDSIDSEHYVDGSIDTAHIADLQVTTAKIADTNVTTAKIADDAVTAAKIPDSSLVSAKYATQSVGTTALADSNVTTAKIADVNITTAKLADANVTTAKIAADAIDGSKLADNAVDSEHYTDGSIDTVHIGDSQVTEAKIADGSVTSAKLNGATVVTNSEHSASTPNDTSFFTTSASDARYFRQDSTETITSGVSWTSDNARVATTGAIDARIIDLVEEVGGFVPIANETSFPTANPDVNNGAGTIVSVSSIGTTRTPSSGTVTIANGAGSGNTVTITGVGTQELTSGFGMLVETTTTLHTYTFHRLTPPATNVNTVATNITNVNTVAGIDANVTTVAGIDSDVTTVANNNTNVTTVAGSIANVNTAAGSIANINTVANDLNEATSEIDTVATNITNVNNVGNDITNVNTVATNISSVNSFANTYRIASSDPTTSLDVGDLVFNTTNNALRVYNGSSWQDGVTASGNFMSKTGDAMSGNLNMQTNKIENVGDATADGDAVSKSFMDSAIDTALTGDVIGGQSITVTDNSPASGQISIAVTGSSIGTTQLADDAVTGAKIADDAVTGAKIADDAVGAEHIEQLDANLQFADSAKAQFGASQDLEIYHDGTNSRIHDAGTGVLAISGSEVHVQSSTQGETCAKFKTDAEVELRYNNAIKFVTKSDGVDVTGEVQCDSLDVDGVVDITGNVTLHANLHLQDSDILRIGTSDDLKLFHDGSNSYIADAGTGNLVITATNLQAKNAANNATYFTATNGGAFTAYHNNASKFATKSDGVDVTGEVQCDSLDVDGGVDIDGGQFVFDATNNRLNLADNVELRLGTGADLRLYHNGTNTHLSNTTGGLFIDQNLNDGDISIRTDDGSGGVTKYILCDGSEGAVNLYHYGSTKLATKSDGIDVTGEVQCDSLDVDGSADITGTVTLHGNLDLQDSDKILLGSGDDLQIYHDGSNSYINDSGSGNLTLVTNGFRVNNAANSENIITANQNAEVNLFYDNSKKLETTSSGVTVTGTVTATAFAGDGSALTGITSFVTGMILMYTGSTAPSGWALCNGSNGTPDLRDRFIVGTGSTYSSGNTGGSKDAVIVSHNHSVSDSGHNHSVSDSGHNHSIPAGTSRSSGGGGADRANTNGTTISTNSATTGISINNATTGVSINNAGESGTNKNLPPYYALAFIMKL